jgi:hypothetical protein
VPLSFRGSKKSGGAKGRGPWLLPETVEGQLVGDGGVLSKNTYESTTGRDYTPKQVMLVLGHMPLLPPVQKGCTVATYTPRNDGAWANVHVDGDCILCRLDAVCTAHQKLIRASKNSSRAMEIKEFRQSVGLHGDMDSSDEDDGPDEGDGSAGPVGPVDDDNAADLDPVNPPEVQAVVGQSGKVVETLESFMRKVSSVVSLTASAKRKCEKIFEWNRDELAAINAEAAGPGQPGGDDGDDALGGGE